MLTLTVRLPESRDCEAVAELRSGFKTVSTGVAVASASPVIAAAHGNAACDPLRPWGHPPFGEYRLLCQVAGTLPEAEEYGGHLLLFEPESGQALDAESFGRLALLVYGGPTDRQGRLRRTQGGVRLADRMLREIVERLDPQADLELRLEPLRAPRWWQFWRRPVPGRPLSQSELEPISPPLDELSVIERLLKGAPRRVPRAYAEQDSLDRDRWRDTSSSEARSAGEAFQGKGGESGGAGASGGWGDERGGRGVDSAGRIIAGAAAAATLVAAAGAASRESSGGRAGEGTGAADTPDTGSGAGTSAETRTSY